MTTETRHDLGYSSAMKYIRTLGKIRVRQRKGTGQNTATPFHGKTTQQNLEGIMLSEIRRSQKGKRI